MVHQRDRYSPWASYSCCRLQDCVCVCCYYIPGKQNYCWNIVFVFIGSLCWLVYSSWIRLRLFFLGGGGIASTLMPLLTINLLDRFQWMFQRWSTFLVLYFKMPVIECLFYQSSHKVPSYFVSTFPFIECLLMLAIWFVSIVTERANHAEDHLKTEANLDKYDG